MSISDLKISGSGMIASGEYNKVSISGAGKLTGSIKCEELHVSGSAKGDGGITANKEMKVSGAAKVDGDITSENISVSGVLKCGNVKCNDIKVSGAITSTGNIEAETVSFSGEINVCGLINAEKIFIKTGNGKVGNIGGTEIKILSPKNSGGVRLPILSKLLGDKGNHFVVEGSIEGDTIALENIKARIVTGSTVAIGDGCDIEEVQYQNEIEISPKAHVGKMVKL